MTPSKYQQDIFDWVKNPTTANLIVQAVAGSGKTTTALKSLEYIDPTASVFFGTFTNTIADELKRRVPPNVRAATLSSYGFNVMRNNTRGRFKMEKDKTEKILQWDVMDFKNLDALHKKDYYKSRQSVSKIISLLKAHAFRGTVPDENLVAELVAKHGVEVPDLTNYDWLRDLLMPVWTRSISEEFWIDFDDMLFYPIFFDMEVEKFDWVFIDEAQDLNPCQIQLVSRMAKGHTVAIGDTYQAIYGFRGADVDAIDKLAEALEAQSAPLSICYRCSKAVIAEAQKIVPHIEAAETAIEGSVTTIMDAEFSPMDGNYVLCRTTAPLVQKCLGLIRNGQRAKVLGREIGQGLIALIATLGLKSNDTLERFATEVDTYRRTATERLRKTGREPEASAIDDRCDTLIALGSRANDVAGIVAEINCIFSDSASPGVTFATVHKSKGLEAKTVFILCPELLPHPAAKLPWQLTQEANLKYVAITRAQDHLVWVKSKPEKKINEN